MTVFKKIEEWIKERKRNRKQQSLKEENVRVIKIGKEALFEFIYETIIDEQENFFDVKSEDVTSSFAIDWERGELIFCVHPCKDSKGTIMQLPEEIDLRQLIKNMPNTTSSLYKENRYQEYTKEELIRLSKGKEKINNKKKIYVKKIEGDVMSDLTRFHDAQENSYGSYVQALAEIKNGRKRSHWMWYIFPQLKGLGYSSTAQYYGIKDLEEAKEYLQDEVLRGRLIEISEALLQLESNDVKAIFGSPDDKKLRSSMTLFLLAEPENEVFRGVLDKFFGGKMDGRTKNMVSER